MKKLKLCDPGAFTKAAKALRESGLGEVDIVDYGRSGDRSAYRFLQLKREVKSADEALAVGPQLLALALQVDASLSLYSFPWTDARSFTISKSFDGREVAVRVRRAKLVVPSLDEALAEGGG